MKISVVLVNGLYKICLNDGRETMLRRTEFSIPILKEFKGIDASAHGLELDFLCSIAGAGCPLLRLSVHGDIMEQLAPPLISIAMHDKETNERERLTAIRVLLKPEIFP